MCVVPTEHLPSSSQSIYPCFVYDLSAKWPVLGRKKLGFPVHHSSMCFKMLLEEIIFSSWIKTIYGSKAQDVFSHLLTLPHHTFIAHTENYYSNCYESGSKGLKRKVNLSVSQARSWMSSLSSTLAYMTFFLALSIHLSPPEKLQQCLPSPTPAVGSQLITAKSICYCSKELEKSVH